MFLGRRHNTISIQEIPVQSSQARSLFPASAVLFLGPSPFLSPGAGADANSADGIFYEGEPGEFAGDLLYATIKVEGFIPRGVVPPGIDILNGSRRARVGTGAALPAHVSERSVGLEREIGEDGNESDTRTVLGINHEQAFSLPSQAGRDGNSFVGNV